jgi:D-alanine-D-alanine ligase
VQHGPTFVTWPAHAVALARRPIVVLHGGTSTEREVSLTSGRAMLAALATPGDGPTARLRPAILPVEIEPGGQWRVGEVGLSPEAAVAALPREALYLLALHGGAGEDGRIAAFLEVAGRVHTGTGHATGALCMHKGHTRLAAAEAGVRVAPGFCALHSSLLRGREAVLARAAALPGEVRFVKHATGGSSVLVFRCTSQPEVARALDAIAAADGDAVVEAAVIGLEVSAGLLGDGDGAHALPVVEILPKGDAGFFDYAEKYSVDGALERCPAEALGAANERRVQDAARATWGAVGGEGYARIDFIVPGPRPGECHPEAEPVLLEVNTLPGFTPRSLLPREAAAVGVDYRALCFEVLARALGRAAQAARKGA